MNKILFKSNDGMLQLNQDTASATHTETNHVEPGMYTVECFAWFKSGLNIGKTMLKANDKSIVIESRGAVQIDGEKTWDRNTIDNVKVGADGVLTIAIHISAGLTNGEDTAFIDNVCYRLINENSKNADVNTNDEYTVNIKFENGMTDWIINGEIADTGYIGAKSLKHTGEGTKDSFKKITDIENGFYTLTGWVQYNGGSEAAYLYATPDNVFKNMTALPRTTFPFDAPDTWKLVTVRGIEITNKTVTIGLYTESKTDKPTVLLDGLRLIKDDRPFEFLIGGDITEITYVEDNGGRFYDFDGNQCDPIKFLAGYGWNIVRIRVYNNPGKGRGTGTMYIPEGYQDINDALNQAKRAKEAGMQIILSLHYSDYWTNPGTQIIPYDWQTAIHNMDEKDAVGYLERAVYDFTKDCLEMMIAQGTPPEYISIGNETRNGMLFPFGTTEKWDNLAAFYRAGSNAAHETLPGINVIIHLDDGGNVYRYEEHFSQVVNRDIEFDIIGTSFYPFWTQKKATDFAEFCEEIAGRFNKPILSMETGFAFDTHAGAGNQSQLYNNGPYGDASASSPELQREFMDELFNATKGVAGGMGIGNIYWDPVMIYADGQTGYAIYESNDETLENVVDNTTLFDFNGKALPVLKSYRYNSEKMSVTSNKVKVGVQY